MQALTPLLFSMLFPRYSQKNAEEAALADREGYPHERLTRTSSSSSSSIRSTRASNDLAFEDGYPIHQHGQDPTQLSPKTRRHHSTGSSGRRVVRQRASVPQAGSVQNQSQQQQRYSLDTYPSLDGLGDMFGPFTTSPSSASTPPPRRSTSSRLRKRASDETPASSPSRASTSSISSMSSDSSSSTAASAREPLTPTTRSPNYHSILLHDHDPSTPLSRKQSPVSGKKDDSELCLSPQSTNFFNEESEAMARSGYEGVVVAGRGQRQLIAH